MEKDGIYFCSVLLMETPSRSHRGAEAAVGHVRTRSVVSCCTASDMNVSAFPPLQPFTH